ncbi:hypothetical protein PG989_010721 [Apiospora arundinis]
MCKVTVDRWNCKTCGEYIEACFRIQTWVTCETGPTYDEACPNYDPYWLIHEDFDCYHCLRAQMIATGHLVATGRVSATGQLILEPLFDSEDNGEDEEDEATEAEREEEWDGETINPRLLMKSQPAEEKESESETEREDEGEAEEGDEETETETEREEEDDEGSEGGGDRGGRK